MKYHPPGFLPWGFFIYYRAVAYRFQPVCELFPFHNVYPIREGTQADGFYIACFGIVQHDAAMGKTVVRFFLT